MKANKHNKIDIYELIINNDERIKNLLEEFSAISPAPCHVAEYMRDMERLEQGITRYNSMMEDEDEESEGKDLVDLVANQEFLLETLERDIEKYTRKEEEH